LSLVQAASVLSIAIDITIQPHMGSAQKQTRKMKITAIVIMCHQCSDAVGWAAGRASGL